MNVLLSPSGFSLLLQGSALPDTIVALQVPAARGWLEATAAGLQIVVSLVVVAMLVAIFLGLSRLAKGIQELTTLLKASHDEISSAVHNVRNVAEHVEDVTRTVRADVAAVSETLQDVNDGARVVIERAGRRLRRLDALVGVAQEEAEEFVLSSASTLRGLRAGATALRRGFMFVRGDGVKRKRRRLRERARRRYEEAVEYDEGDFEDDSAEERPRIRRKVPDKP